MKHVLFLCFPDTEAERNALKEHVYPKLRDFCRENYGIEFQVTEICPSICSLVFLEVCQYLLFGASKSTPPGSGGGRRAPKAAGSAPSSGQKASEDKAPAAGGWHESSRGYGGGKPRCRP